MSENSADSQVPSESAIDLSTTHIILLGLGGVFGLLLGVAALTLAYYCHRKNKLKDKEKGDIGTVHSSDESVGAATLTKNFRTAGTVVLDMDQITSTNSHEDSTPNKPIDSSLNNPIHSPSVDSPPNSLVDSPSSNPVYSSSYNSIDFTPPNNSVDALPITPEDFSPSNSVYSPPNFRVDSSGNNSLHSLPTTPVYSSANNSVHTLPNTPVYSPPNNSADSLPNTPVDSPPNNTVDSLPITPADSTPNTSVDSLPITPADSTPNTPVDSPPNNSVNSLPITPADSTPITNVDSPLSNSVDPLLITPVDSTLNNSEDSLPSTPVDSPLNNSVDPLLITPIDSPLNNSEDSLPSTPVDSPLNNAVDSIPSTPVDSPPNNSVESLPITPLDSPPSNSVDSPQNNSVETPGDLPHPEAISPNIFNKTSAESPNDGGLRHPKEFSVCLSALTPSRMKHQSPPSQCTSGVSAGRPQTSLRSCSQDCDTMAVSPPNLENVEAKEMPEPIFVLPNREVCQEGYLSVTKDEETPCKEDGYIRELKGDGDLICQDTIAKNNRLVKETETEMNVLSELQILQEKVRALEQQNAALIKAHSPSEIHGDEKEKTFRDKDAHSRMNEGLNSSVGSFKIEDMKLIDVDCLEREGGTWLMTVNKGQVKEGLEIPVGQLKGNTPIAGSPMEGLEWLRRESGVSDDLAASRNTLVNRLNGLASAFTLPAWMKGDAPPLKQTSNVNSSQDKYCQNGSQDLLLDHTNYPSQATDLRRSMPNLNKSKCRGAARPQYSLAQNQNHNSETRLQRPSHLQAPESQRVHTGSMRDPTCPPNSRGRPATGGGKLQSGLRPSSEGLARKSSLPARPSGISMPSSTGPSGTSRSSSIKLPSGTRPSSNGPSGTSKSSSTKLPSGTRPSSNGPSGTISSSSTRLPSGNRPSSTRLAAPSARRGLARGNIGGTRVA